LKCGGRGTYLTTESGGVGNVGPHPEHPECEVPVVGYVGGEAGGDVDPERRLLHSQLRTLPTSRVRELQEGLPVQRRPFEKKQHYKLDIKYR
jgi:hypothetical protein